MLETKRTKRTHSFIEADHDSDSSTAEEITPATRKRPVTTSYSLLVECVTTVPDEHTCMILVGRERSFKVSRNVLLEVRSFRAYFSETSKTDAPLRLPHDSPDAMRLLFLILHHAVCELPMSITSAQLFDLATASGKYEALEIVTLHLQAQGWIDDLWIFGRPISGDWESWIFPLQAFKQVERLDRSFDIIAANMRKTDGLLQLPPLR
jgi:hypothetical protein